MKKIVFCGVSFCVLLSSFGFCSKTISFVNEKKLVFASDLRNESNKEYLKCELNMINGKYGTNFYVVDDFDYERISRKQLNDCIELILKDLNKVDVVSSFDFDVNCSVANSSVAVPSQTILCAMWPVQLEGTIFYTADSGKFKSIDSVNTWITGDEFLIKHTWSQQCWDSCIVNGGKKATVSLRGTLKGEMLVKGSPIAFTQEVDRAFSLDF